jgi:hypothetical protein
VGRDDDIIVAQRSRAEEHGISMHPELPEQMVIDSRADAKGAAHNHGLAVECLHHVPVDKRSFTTPTR